MCVGACGWVGECVAGTGRLCRRAFACRRGDGGAGEQMTLTAECDNLAAAMSRGIFVEGAIKSANQEERPKNANKIDKKR